VVIENPVTGDLSLCGGDPVCEGQTHTTEILYDELGNRTRLIDPDAGTILTTYDARGMVDTEEDARGFVQDFTIDDLGRLVRRHAVNPQGMESDDVFEYGLAGVHGPNQVGRLVRVDDAEGHAEFDDDEAGNLSWHRRVVQGREFDFTRTYDPLGRVVDTSYPDGEVATWHYDKRLLTRISTAGGDYGDDYVASIAYDALDRLTGVELGGSAGSPAVTQSWGYDPISGRLDSIAAVVGGSSVDLDYTIDGVGRIRAIKSEFTIAPAAPVLRSFTFEYDGLDRLTEAAGDYDTVDPLLQKTLRYDHDVLGNLVQKDSDADAQVDDGWALSYQDPTRPHAVTSSVPESGFPTRAFDYDASGNVTSKWTQASATDPLVEALLTYDSVGRLVEYDPQTSPGLIWALGYDGFGRRIVSKRGGLTLLYPEPGYEYHQNLTRVNKHFFVGGRRVASSEVAWTAPEAGATPSALAAGRPALAALASRPGLRGPALAAPRLRPARAALARGDGEAPSARARRAPGHVPVLHDGRQLQLLAQPAGHARGDGPLLRHRPPGVDCGHGQARRHRPERLPVPALRGHVIDSGPVIHHRFAGEDLLGSGLIALGPRSYDPELGRFLQPGRPPVAQSVLVRPEPPAQPRRSDRPVRREPGPQGGDRAHLLGATLGHLVLGHERGSHLRSATARHRPCARNGKQLGPRPRTRRRRRDRPRALGRRGGVGNRMGHEAQ